MPARDLLAVNTDIENAVSAKNFPVVAGLLLEMLVDNPGDDDAIDKVFEYLENNFEDLIEHARPGVIKILDATAMANYPFAYAVIRSRLCIGAGRTAEAEQSLLALHESIPADQNVVDLLIDLYSDSLNDPDRALEYLDADIALEAAKASPNKAHIAKRENETATIYLDRKEDYEQALAHVRLALNNDPDKYDYHFNHGLAHKELEHYAEAEEALKKALLLAVTHQEQGDAYYMLGEIADLQYKSRSAVDQYLKALQYLPNDIYALHNLTAGYRKLGDFKKSNQYLKKAREQYSDGFQIGAFDAEPAKYYYYAQLIKEFISPKSKADYDLWKSLLLQYQGKLPDDLEGEIEVFLYCVARLKAIDEGELFDRDYAGERMLEWEDTHADMVNGYNYVTEKLMNKIAGGTNPFNQKYRQFRLGQVHLAFEYYEEAIAAFDEAVKIDHNYCQAIEARGVAYFRFKKYNEATASFEKAVKQNRLSLNLNCNLGDSLRAMGETDEGEIAYTRVKHRCAEYVDALIGLGECAKIRADKLLDTGEHKEAEEQFGVARKYFMQSFDQQNKQNPSRHLTVREKNALHYSLGYTMVKLYEAGKGSNAGLMYIARSEFNKIPKSASEYLKAKKAVHIINEKVSIRMVIGKNATPLICVLAALIFLGTQFFALRTFLHNNEMMYVLNKDAIVKLNTGLGADSTLFTNAIAPAMLGTFDKREDLKEWIDKELNEKFRKKLDAGFIIEKPAHLKVDMDMAAYGFFTFGSLMFMIIGLFLPFIQKLKVGSIEMEKNVVDTVRTTASVIQK